MRLCLTLLILISSCAMAEPVDRLFFSPSERDQLERARERSSSPGQLVVPSVTGFIVRSDGRNTVWLDGIPFPANERQLAQAARVGPEVPVRVRSTLGDASKPKKSSLAKVPDKP